MSDMYRITYHLQVSNDLKSIGTRAQRHVRQAIETKLALAPVRFGKPLQHSLRGLRSLRVGDYRVVFQLSGRELFIVLIAHRSVVYKRAHKRSL